MADSRRASSRPLAGKSLRHYGLRQLLLRCKRCIDYTEGIGTCDIDPRLPYAAIMLRVHASSFVWTIATLRIRRLRASRLDLHQLSDTSLHAD
eukprot:scaffold229977_cov30-Tisochrysis_lutea.AAC.4